MSEKTVLIFGASARALAQSANRAGYRVYAADQFADVDTQEVAHVIESKNPEDWLAATAADGTFLSVYVGGMENRWEQVQKIEEHSILLGNDSSVLRRLQDKLFLLDWVARKGYPVPVTLAAEVPRILNSGSKPSHFRSFHEESPLETLIAQGKRVLKKKILSCGGLGVVEVIHRPGESPLASPPEPSITGQHEYFFQELVEGQNFSAIYLAYRTDSKTECRLLGISRQLCGDPQFHARGFVYTGSILEPRPDRHLVEFATAIGHDLAVQYELIGLFNIDLIQRGEDYYFLEINPRYSASMELWERLTDVNLFELQKAASQCECPGTAERIESRLLESRQAARSKYQYSGKAIWYADQPTVTTAQLIDQARQYNQNRSYPGIADLPRSGARIEEASPIFTVFQTGETLQQVAEKLKKTARIFDSSCCSRTQK